MNQHQILLSLLETCKLHAQRLHTALHHLGPFLPMTPQQLSTLKDEEIAYFELLTSRFAKLQDTLGSKVFPCLLKCLMEDVEGSTLPDMLARLEKLNLISSMNFWVELRTIRNFVSHEYPGDVALTVHHLNQIHQASLRLLEYWQFLLDRMKTLTFPAF